MLILIGVFVFFAAGAEAQGVQLRALADGLTVRDAMVREVNALSASATLGEAVDALIATSQKEFPVLAPGGGVLGLLTRDRLIVALKERGEDAPAAGAVDGDVPVVEPWLALATGLEMLERTNAPALIVEDPRQGIIGLLTRENVGEMLMVEAASPGRGFAHRRV